MSTERQPTLLERLARQPPALLGGATLDVALDDPRHATLTFEHRGHGLALYTALLTVPYPSGLERLLAAEPEVEAVVVDRVPPGLAAAADARGISYLDRDGRGSVIGPGFVYVTPPRIDLGQLSAPSRTSPFAPTTSRIVRALLSDPGRPWGVTELARLTLLNPGNAHRALASLIELGHVERDRDAYVLVDAGSLLEAWADQYRPPKETFTVPVSGSLHQTVAETVAAMDGSAVVSGELAAEMLAPHLPARSAIVHCLDPGAWSPPQRDEPLLNRALRMLTTPVDTVLVALSDVGTGQFGDSVDGLDLASAAQIYVDLARASGRPREAADEVRRQVLRY